MSISARLGLILVDENVTVDDPSTYEFYNQYVQSVTSFEDWMIANAEDKNLFINGNLTFNSSTGAISWSGVSLFQPRQDGIVSINDGSDTLTDGQFLYVTVTRPYNTSTLSVSKSSVSLTGKDIIVIAARIGNKIHTKIPLTGNAYATREYVVGDQDWMYATIADAIAAVNTNPPTANDRALIKLTPGFYTMTSTLTVPGYTTIQGSDKNTTRLFNQTTDLFTVNGSYVVFEDFTIEGANVSSLYGIECNNNSEIRVSRVDFSDYSGTATSRYLHQTGSVWSGLIIEDFKIKSHRADSYMIYIYNTGAAARDVNTVIKNTDIEVKYLTSAGGAYFLQGLQNITFEFCTLIGDATYFIGINKTSGVTGTPWARIRYCYGEGFQPLHNDANTTMYVTQTDALGSDFDGDVVYQDREFALNSGHLAIDSPATAVADADLLDNQLSHYLDETNDILNIKTKDSGSNIQIFSISPGGTQVLTTVANTDTAVTNAHAEELIITGTAIMQTYTIASALTLRPYRPFKFVNWSTQFVGIKNDDNSLFVRLAPAQSLDLLLVAQSDSHGTWAVRLSDISPSYGMYEKEDCFSIAPDIAGGKLGFIDYTSGTLAAFGNFGTLTNKGGGYWFCRTGTDSTSGVQIHTNTKDAKSENYAYAFESKLKFLALATVGEDYFFRFGWEDAATSIAGTDNGIYLLYKRATSTNWIYGSDDGTPSETPSSIAATTGDTRVRIEKANGADRVDFWVGTTRVGSKTTNIPTSLGYLASTITNTAGSTNHFVLYDSMSYTASSNTSRG